jgi:type I restriction enzyme S subunit
MPEWNSYPLEVVLDFREGPGIMAVDFRGSGVPLIRLAGLKSGANLLAGCNFLDPEKVQKKWSQFRLKKGDVLLSTSASLGEVAVVDESGEGSVPYTGIIAFRTRDKGLLDQRFIKFVLTAPTFKDQIEAMGVGSVMRHFGPSHLRHMQVYLPPVRDQWAIAEVLGALDEKIVANDLIAATLTQLIHALFERTASSCTERIGLSELVTATKGVSYRSADLQPSQTALVTLKSIDRHGGYASRGLKSYSGPFKSAQQLSDSEIVVAQTDLTQEAEVVGRAVRVPRSDAFDRLVASLDLVIVRPNANICPEYILGLLSQERFREHCRSMTSGTTVLHLASGALASYEAPRVSLELQQQYSLLARPILEMRDALGQECFDLLKVRDTLFPLLMSGKVHLKDAAKRVEAVA